MSLPTSTKVKQPAPYLLPKTSETTKRATKTSSRTLAIKASVPLEGHEAKEAGEQGENREHDGVVQHRTASFLERGRFSPRAGATPPDSRREWMLNTNSHIIDRKMLAISTVGLVHLAADEEFEDQPHWPCRPACWLPRPMSTIRYRLAAASLLAVAVSFDSRACSAARSWVGSGFPPGFGGCGAGEVLPVTDVSGS